MTFKTIDLFLHTVAKNITLYIPIIDKIRNYNTETYLNPSLILYGLENINIVLPKQYNANGNEYVKVNLLSCKNVTISYSDLTFFDIRSKKECTHYATLVGHEDTLKDNTIHLNRLDRNIYELTIISF